MNKQKIPRPGVQANYLTLLIGQQMQQMRVRMRDTGITIGRNTKRKSIDVDLKPFDGIEKGVSREHVIITPKDDHFLVEDLETINSTWLNRVRLNPMTPKALYHGDVLHLGELRIQVYYTYDDEILKGLGATTNFAASQPGTQTLADDLPESQKSTRILNTDDGNDPSDRMTGKLNDNPD